MVVNGTDVSVKGIPDISEAEIMNYIDYVQEKTEEPVDVISITRRADGYHIIHVESGKDGDFPLVNGAPIGPQARKLHDNDVLQLAGVKMGFFVG